MLRNLVKNYKVITLELLNIQITVNYFFKMDDINIL